MSNSSWIADFQYLEFGSWTASLNEEGISAIRLAINWLLSLIVNDFLILNGLEVVGCKLGLRGCLQGKLLVLEFVETGIRIEEFELLELDDWIGELF